MRQHFTKDCLVRCIANLEKCYSWYGDILFFCSSFCPGSSSELLWIQWIQVASELEKPFHRLKNRPGCRHVCRSLPSRERKKAESKQRHAVNRGTGSWQLQCVQEVFGSHWKPGAMEGNEARWQVRARTWRNCKQAQKLSFTLWIIWNPEED